MRVCALTTLVPRTVTDLPYPPRPLLLLLLLLLLLPLYLQVRSIDGRGSCPRTRGLPSITIARPYNKTFFVSSIFPVTRDEHRPRYSSQAMESLGEEPWDVVIHGTGLHQSLLAL